MSAFHFLIFLHILNWLALKFLLASFFFSYSLDVDTLVCHVCGQVDFSFHRCAYFQQCLLLEASHTCSVLLKPLWGRASQDFSSVSDVFHTNSSTWCFSYTICSRQSLAPCSHSGHVKVPGFSQMVSTAHSRPGSSLLTPCAGRQTSLVPIQQRTALL